MLVWLVKDGEYLPIQSGGRRMRMGMLAHALMARGHRVVWWSSTFSHQEKKHVAAGDTTISVEPGCDLRLLEAGGYRDNLSVARFRHHSALAHAFRRAITVAEAPDLIVASFPIPQLTSAAVDFACSRAIPVIVDVRDLWPDALWERFPGPVQSAGGFALQLARRVMTNTFRRASAIVGVSEGYLRWGLDVARRPRSPRDAVFYLGFDDQEPCRSAISPDIEQLVLELRRQNKVVFTFTGTFGHSYDVAGICEAAESLLRQNRTEAHFVLGGNGVDFERVREHARRLPNVSLPGWLSGDEIHAVLSASHVGLVPRTGTSQTIPNKPFEYLARGLPILSSLRGEMEQLIAETNIGLSYIAGDRAQLVQAIVRMLDAPELRALQARNALDVFRSRFSSRNIYAGFCEYLEGLHAEDRRQVRLAV